MGAADIMRLREIAKKDNTVATYFNSLDKGVLFDDMIVNLAIQLTKEKADARRMLRNEIKGKENPLIIGLLGEAHENN